MEFCQNCGHKLNPGQKFCPQCGTVQDKDMEENVTSPVSEPKQKRAGDANRKPTFFQSKGFKIIAIVVIVIAIAIFGTYKYIASTLTPEKIEGQFVNAVKKQNVKEMKKILNKNQTELSFNDDVVSDFLAYFKKHPDVFAETVAQLKKDAGNLDINKDYNNRKDPVNLVKDGKKWLIFNYYAVNLEPYYVKVETNETPVDVTINGKSVGKLSEKKSTFGPYLLSDIKIKGSYKAQYTTVTAEESLDPYEEDSQHLAADLDFSGNTVTIYSNNDDAVLYVNGKSTGKKIADIDQFGPVPVDGSMKLQAVLNIDSHTVKSNEGPITEEGQEIDLEFPETDFDGMDTVEEYDGDAGYQDGETDTDSIGQVVSEHYQDISSGNYEDAYGLMSSERRSKYNFADWKKGLEANYRNDVEVSDVQKINDTNAVVSFTLTSYDQNSNGSNLVQVWGGKWNLVYEDDQWLLNKPEIKKLDSYTE